MAAPQPETGGPFPSRATTQPTQPLGQAASGEKDLLKDLRLSDVRPADLRFPDPLPSSEASRTSEAPVASPMERPLAKPSVRSVAAIPERPLTKPPQRPVAPAADRVPAKGAERPLGETPSRTARPATPSSASSNDWGLATTQKQGSIVGRVAVGVLLIGTVAGGYYGYTEYSRPPTESPKIEEEEAVPRDNVEPPLLSDDDAAPEHDDPFNDATAPTRKAQRTSAAPRLAHHTTAAIPIQSAGKQAAGNRTGKPQPMEHDAEPTLELPLDLDEASDDDADMELEETSQPPVLKVPQPPRDRRATAQEGDGRKRSQNAAGSDDELGDYTLADEPLETGTARNEAGPKLILEAQDERVPAEQLEGFEPEEGNRRRAIAKTVVVRSESVSSESLPGVDSNVEVDDDDEWVPDNTRPTSRPAPGPVSRPDKGAVPSKIQPRSAASSETGLPPRELRPAAQSLSRSETYTVVPNDNFWTISRKQYGSGRYFAALARHNQQLIPDPQRLRPGMHVSTPSVTHLEERYPELIDKSGAPAVPAPAATRNVSGDNRPQFGTPAALPPAAVKPAASQAAGYFYSNSGEPQYRIGADDTLSGIAQRHLGRSSRWTEIYEQNREILQNPENLPLGAVIRLPSDASRVGLAPDVERRR